MSEYILPFQLAPSLDEADLSYVREIFYADDRPPLPDLLKMADRCPYTGAAISLKALRIMSSLGKYTHPDTTLRTTQLGRMTIAEWVNANFEIMVGSIEEYIGKMYRQTEIAGFSTGEIVFQKVEGEAQLKKIVVLNPNLYDFRGKEGEWDGVIYKSRYRSPFPIPKEKLIHLYTPSIEEPENPYGYPNAARAYPYYEARRHALIKWSTKMAIDARGFLIIQGDSNDSVAKRNASGEVLLKNDGSPQTEPALSAAAKAAKGIGDGSVFAIDSKYRVQHQSNTSGMGSDFELGLRTYAKNIFMAFGIPSTIFEEGSATLGQAGLNFGHRLTLDAQIEQQTEICRNQLLEKVIRPLLLYNFGDRYKRDLGTFKTDKFLDPAAAAMRTSTLMSAMLQGIVDPNDFDAVNRIRDDCGLNTIDRDLWEYQLAQKLYAEEQQALLEQQYGAGNS